MNTWQQVTPQNNHNNLITITKIKTDFLAGLFYSSDTANAYLGLNK